MLNDLNIDEHFELIIKNSSPITTNLSNRLKNLILKNEVFFNKDFFNKNIYNMKRYIGKDLVDLCNEIRTNILTYYNSVYKNNEDLKYLDVTVFYDNKILYLFFKNELDKEIFFESEV